MVITLSECGWSKARRRSTVHRDKGGRESECAQRETDLMFYMEETWTFIQSAKLKETIEGIFSARRCMYLAVWICVIVCPQLFSNTAGPIDLIVSVLYDFPFVVALIPTSWKPSCGINKQLHWLKWKQLLVYLLRETCKWTMCLFFQIWFLFVKKRKPRHFLKQLCTLV